MLKKLTLIAGLVALAALVAGTGPASAQGVMYVTGGKVGVGTNAPEQLLHVKAAAGARLLVQDTAGALSGGVLMNLKNNGPAKSFYENTATGNQWNLGMSGTNFLINNVGKTPLLSILSNGNVTTPGSFLSTSTRAAKQDFESVDAVEVLERVVALPISEWSYKYSPEMRHMGPVAEDFWAQFGLGMDDKHLAPADTSGVALAAIKGLHEVIQDRDAEIRSLNERLERLEALLASR